MRRLAVFRRAVHDQPARLRSAADEHLRIVEAVFADKPDEAAQAMRDHILAKGRAVNDVMQRVREIGAAPGGGGRGKRAQRRSEETAIPATISTNANA